MNDISNFYFHQKVFVDLAFVLKKKKMIVLQLFNLSFFFLISSTNIINSYNITLGRSHIRPIPKTLIYIFIDMYEKLLSIGMDNNS